MNHKASLPDLKRNKSLKFITDLSSSRREINLRCQEPDRTTKANMRCLCLEQQRGRENGLGGGTLN